MNKICLLTPKRVKKIIIFNESICLKAGFVMHLLRFVLKMNLNVQGMCERQYGRQNLNVHVKT